MTAISPTTPLYQLADIRDQLDELLAFSEGEVTDDIAAVLDALEGATKEKVERVGLYVRELLATAKAIKEERDRLDERAHAKERAAEGLKRYLLANMQRLELKKVDGLLCTVAVQINSQPSVTTPLEAVDLYAFDETRPFVKREEKIVFTLDRDRILAAWKNNEALPASIVVERSSHIRIR